MKLWALPTSTTTSSTSASKTKAKANEMLQFLVPRPRVPSYHNYKIRIPTTARSFASSRPSSSAQSSSPSTANSLAEYSSATTSSQPSSTSSESSKTHFKITLRRSAIALTEDKKATLVALGLHRRLQTVFHRHTPEAAGKILKVKELVAVENVAADEVMDKTEMRRRRKAPLGFGVVNEMKSEQRFGLL